MLGHLSEIFGCTSLQRRCSDQWTDSSVQLPPRRAAASLWVSSVTHVGVDFVPSGRACRLAAISSSLKVGQGRSAYPLVYAQRFTAEMPSRQRVARSRGVQSNRIPRTIDLPTTTAAISLIGMCPIRNWHYLFWVDLGVNLGRRILVFLGKAGDLSGRKKLCEEFPEFPRESVDPRFWLG